MKIKHSISILFMILLLASCKDGLTIFDQIDQETKLEEAVITGSVNSIVRSGNTLYASDGNIYAKSVNAERGWSKIASPGGTIIKLAADDSWGLYALNSNQILYFYSENDKKWQTVDTTGIGTIETIFCDGDDNAFVKAGGSIYPLNKHQVGAECTWTHSTITVFCSDGTNLYYADGGTVYVTAAQSLIDNTAFQPEIDRGSVSGLGIIYSLTYSKAEKALYAGTSGGLKKIILDEMEKLTGIATPPGNWAATINTYEAFAVLATGTTADDSALYSSTIKGDPAYAKINGLWGYYYNRRNNWNRE